MSVNEFTADRLEGRKVVSSDGEKVGKVDGVLTDDRGMPQYLEIKTGWFGSKRHAVPIQQVQGSLEDDGDLVVPYTKEQLENAPTLDDHEDLDYEREQNVGRHYGVPVREWDDTRDRWLPEEDLSRGPTPETRHPAGGLDSPADTTQGPTPETRAAERLAGRDDAAAGQPESDPRTRHGGVGPGDAHGVHHDDRHDDVHDRRYDERHSRTVEGGAVPGGRVDDRSDRGLRDDRDGARDPRPADAERLEHERAREGAYEDGSRGGYDDDTAGTREPSRRRLRRWDREVARDDQSGSDVPPVR